MSEIFLSSPFVELRHYRDAAANAIDLCGHHCVRMETFYAQAQGIPAVCREYIEPCKLVILVFGKLYGTIIPGREISYTEYEFEVAKELNKTILVFIAHKDARTEFEAALGENDLTGRERNLQKAFLQRATKGVLPIYFENPEDLRTKIAVAVEKTLPRPQPLPPQPPKEVPPEDLPILCDRRPQIEAFMDTFQKERGLHVYALWGHEQQQHKSCVQRLIREGVFPEGVPTSVLPEEKSALINWPESFDDAPEIVLGRLCRNLCQSLKPQLGGNCTYAPVDLVRHIQDSGVNVFRFRHAFLAQRWTAAAQAFCSDHYLKFWIQVAGEIAKAPAENRPRAFVFFEFKHKLGTDEEKQAFRATLTAVFRESAAGKQLSAQVLPELNRIDLDHLDDWRDRYEKYLLPQYRAEPLENLFPDPPLFMIHVEKRLRTIVGMETTG